MITKYYKNKDNKLTYAQFTNQKELDSNLYNLIEKEEYYELVKYTPSEEELKDREIQEARQFLSDTDNYAIRLATGEAKEDDYSQTYKCTFKQIMDKRKEKRNKIQELEVNN